MEDCLSDNTSALAKSVSTEISMPAEFHASVAKWLVRSASNPASRVRISSESTFLSLMHVSKQGLPHLYNELSSFASDFFESIDLLDIFLVLAPDFVENSQFSYEIHKKKSPNLACWSN